MIRGLINHEGWRFVLAGGFNTILSYVVFAALLSLGFNHWWANLAALMIGIFVAFQLGGKFVFRKDDLNLWWRFIFGWVIIYVVISFGIGLLIQLGVGSYVSGLLALPFSATLSFFMQKYYVFWGPKDGCS